VSEPLPEPAHSGETVEPVDPARALARKNNLTGLALLAIYLAIAAGVVVVALIYDSLANY
jgi:hypothetical protein